MSIPKRSVGPDELDLGPVGPEHMRINSNGGLAIAIGSTTDTANYIAALSGALYLPTPRVQFRAPFLLQMKHTVASARAELFVALYNEVGLVTGRTIWYAGGGTPDAVALHSVAGEWTVFSGVGIGYPDASNIEAGTRYLAIVVKNRTAGTLSWSRGTGFDFLAFDMVGY